MAPRSILLINPNTSQATTAMMVEAGRSVAPHGVTVTGATASRGPGMIVDAAALAASAVEVIEIGRGHAPGIDGIIVAAFGDPGLQALRDLVDIPVVGIAEAAMHQAAQGGRRFGIATVTPGLAAAISARVAALGLSENFSGIRVTSVPPVALAADPGALVEALHDVVSRCVHEDGAQAVIIGGGPLADAAAALAGRFDVPIIAPVAAAMRRLLGGG